jgi:hypothetical protein
MTQNPKGDMCPNKPENRQKSTGRASEREVMAQKIANGAKEHPEKHLFVVFGEMRPWSRWIM